MSRNRTLLHALAAAGAVVLCVSWTASAVPLQAAKAAPEAMVNLSDSADAKDLKLVHKVNPAYPADAKKDRVQGVFVVDLVIGKDGAIHDPRVVLSAPTLEQLKTLEPQKGTPAALQGDARLADAALAAVRQWTYAPILREGKPVEAKATVTVRFLLD